MQLAHKVHPKLHLRLHGQIRFLFIYDVNYTLIYHIERMHLIDITSLSQWQNVTHKGHAGTAPQDFLGHVNIY
jgi:hypothetical protein